MIETLYAEGWAPVCRHCAGNNTTFWTASYSFLSTDALFHFCRWSQLLFYVLKQTNHSDFSFIFQIHTFYSATFPFIFWNISTGLRILEGKPVLHLNYLLLFCNPRWHRYGDKLTLPDWWAPPIKPKWTTIEVFCYSVACEFKAVRTFKIDCRKWFRAFTSHAVKQCLEVLLHAGGWLIAWQTFCGTLYHFFWY